MSNPEPNLTDPEIVGPLEKIVCDTCHREVTEAWFFPHEGYVLRMFTPKGPHDVDFAAGDWAACDECAALMKNGDWMRMLKRFEENQPPMNPALTGILSANMGAILRHITGPPVLLDLQGLNRKWFPELEKTDP